MRRYPASTLFRPTRCVQLLEFGLIPACPMSSMGCEHELSLDEVERVRESSRAPSCQPVFACLPLPLPLSLVRNLPFLQGKIIDDHRDWGIGGLGSRAERSFEVFPVLSCLADRSSRASSSEAEYATDCDTSVIQFHLGGIVPIYDLQ